MGLWILGMLAFPPYHFKAMICTGGIGSGSLFLLNGDHTLAREESRGGRYLDARDYCKMHIIAHNVKKLSDEDFSVFAIGKVGDDAVGKEVLQEMADARIDLTYVSVSPGDRTLFGFCFLYPDGTGGNLTTEESACGKVDPEYIWRAEETFRSHEGQLIALAAPEVSLEARNALLQLSHKYGGFSVATFTSGEMKEAERLNMLSLVQLLAINIDEAAMIAHLDSSVSEPLFIVEALVRRVKEDYPKMCLSVTAGKNGSWTWDGSSLNFYPSLEVEVKSSAGAGDAHISAIIAGLRTGLNLAEAQQLGNLAGGVAVTSQHTIHPEMSRKKILEVVGSGTDRLSPNVIRFLTNQ
jgi:ribokinase